MVILKLIFEEGNFNLYSKVELRTSQESILQHSQYGVRRKTTVFVSHSHDDLNDLKGILGFLEQNYDVNVYIDSQDPTMPKTTSEQTALNLKQRIKQCDKFILLATNKAIASEWCNWELGYGDAQKFKEHIALFLLKPKGVNDSDYKGTEYMKIYPYITYFNGTETYRDGKPITRGYYIRTMMQDGRYCIEPLDKWLQKR